MWGLQERSSEIVTPRYLAEGTESRAVPWKSRKENPQKPTQLTSRSHPRHLVGKRTAQKTPP